MTREAVLAAWAAARDFLQSERDVAALRTIAEGSGQLGARLALRMLAAFHGDRGWALSVAASHAAGLPGGGWVACLA